MLKWSILLAIITLFLILLPASVSAQTDIGDSTGGINYYDPNKGEIYWTMVENSGEEMVTISKVADNYEFYVNPITTKNLESFPVEVYQKLYDEIGNEVGKQVLYTTSKDISDIKDRSVTIPDITELAKRGNVFVKFGEHSITYSAVTNVITFNQNSSASGLFEDIYQADVAGGWGVFSQCSASGVASRCYCSNAKIVISTGNTVADNSCSIYFTPNVVTANGQYWIEVQGNSTATFGTLNDAVTKSTSNGVEFIPNENSGFGYIGGDVAATIYFYGCTFMNAHNTGYGYVFRANRVWGSHLGNRFGINAIQSNAFNCIINGPSVGFLSPSTSATISDIIISGKNSNDYGVYFTSNISQIYRNIDMYYLQYDLYASNFSGQGYTINCSSDSWNTRWVGATTSGTITRQYTYDLMVTDNSGNPISNANVYLVGSTSGTVASLTTGITGEITQQRLNVNDFNAANGDTPINVENPYTVIIQATGYEGYTGTFDIYEATVRVKALSEVGTHSNPFVIGWMEENIMSFTFVFFGLAGIVIYYIWKRIVTGALASIMLFILGAWFYQQSESSLDIYHLTGMFIMFIALFFSWEVFTDMRTERKDEREENITETLEELEYDLQDAIDQQDYILARKIQNKIDALRSHEEQFSITARADVETATLRGKIKRTKTNNYWKNFDEDGRIS